LWGLIHTDICEPITIYVIVEYIYFISFINDKFRYGYVYLMKQSVNHLKGSKDLEIKLKNKLERVSKYFDLIEVVNTWDKYFKII
jgi:hypothetical protein